MGNIMMWLYLDVKRFTKTGHWRYRKRRQWNPENPRKLRKD